jgi:transcriptional regulator
VVYLPQHFAETDVTAMHQLIRDFPLGTLVTLGAAGLTANHIPFVLDTRAGEQGRLLGHVARNNPVWYDHDPDQDALVVFQSMQAYITPNWYATKRETHEVVPTWNYAVVHAYGIMRVMDDEAWLRTQIGDLTRFNEAARTAPWAVTDAPKTFVDAMVRGIIGLEIEIARIEGKWKVSQNRPEADREGVVEGLRAEADERADAMAELVEAFGAKG